MACFQIVNLSVAFIRDVDLIHVFLKVLVGVVGDPSCSVLDYHINALVVAI